jgi:uncharacterized protein (TIGR02680 family)
MTLAPLTAPGFRFQLNRAGVLNVWQYDEQIFDFQGGRLLLRGTNGAGKSKTLELLLPFCIDGDRQRMNATGRAQTALTWLMLDGVEEKLRTGYVWVEFRRMSDDGEPEFLTCGVGLRASRSANSVSSWMFCTPQRIGVDLRLEDADGPLGKAALDAIVPPPGRVFETARDYRAYVGRLLFGLDPGRYDDLLRLLYWLRQPQIGEEIDPKKIAHQLVQSLPELDSDELAQAGSTLDELADFGEKLRRTEAAGAAVASGLEVYRRYARGVTHQRSSALTEAVRERRRLQRAVRQHERDHDALVGTIEHLARQLEAAESRSRAARAEMDTLAASPEEARLEDSRGLAEAAISAVSQQDLALTQAQRALAATVESADVARGHLEETARRLDRDVDDIAVRSRRAAIVLPTGFGGTGSAVTASADPVELEARVERWVSVHGEALDRLAQAVAVKQAAVREVRAAAVAQSQLRSAADTASQLSDAASARADGLRASVTELELRATAAASRWLDAVHAWAEDLPGPALDTVAWARELDVDAVIGDASAEDLAPRVAAEAAPAVAELRRVERELHGDRVAAGRELAEIVAALEAVRLETDPAPPPASLPRDRDHVMPPSGAPLWRAVDFVDPMEPAERAAVEAALQQSGLLDAWIDRDGILRDNAFDILVTPTSPVDGPSLAAVLRSTDDDPLITDLLTTIALVDRADDSSHDGAVIGRDGSFRVGPLRGRATKPVAQYIGATARAAERARRIDTLEAQRSEREARLTELEASEQAAATAVAVLERWITAVPPVLDVVRSRDRLDEGRRSLVSAEGQAHAAEEAAAAARLRAAQSLFELNELGGRHDVPVNVDELDRLGPDLRELHGDVTRHRDAIGSLASRVAESHLAESRRAEAASFVTDATELLHQLQTEADARQQAYESLVAALSETLSQLTARRQQARATYVEANQTVSLLRPNLATERSNLAVLEERRAQSLTMVLQQDVRVRLAAARLCGLRDVPGLLAAAFGSVNEEHDRALASPLDETGASDELVAVAHKWTELLADAPAPDSNGVLHIHGELTTGHAASHEPALTVVNDAYAIVARDGTVSVTLAELAALLTDRVEQQSQLLTARERDAFEQVLLGSLGDELRRRLQEAHELVDGMNDLLGDIRTSQGIRVRLRWRVRDDTPPEARDVTDLVARSSSALLPDERDRLHRAMSQLLALAADDAPDDGYAEHLSRALDYRTWHEFRVQYTRPGTDDWLDLSRRSPLSQGEQKVACYLPLFAAAAAHFTSVAGAAPQAPRFVLLDDAFPKIDARTHPLLFGLLVQLDLDFVVTSERLWGDHPELPELAIYEALRNPGEPGIAQAHYTWDGRALQAVGTS